MISKRALLLAATVLLGLSPAMAEPTELGQFSDWRVYRTTDKDGTVCFALSEPTAKKPATAKRGAIYFMISAWPGAKVSGQPSIVPGYPYDEKIKASVEVGGEKFEFYTLNEGEGGDGGAWIKDPKDETRLLAAMRKGSDMTVKGTSRRGTVTTDSYSLKGISAALDKITTDCSA